MNKYQLICLMVPTYKRPDRIATFIDSALKFADDPHRLRFSFCVNEKDTATRDYINSRFWLSDDYYEIITEDTMQPNLSLYFNLMYKNTRFKDAIVTEMGDDMVFLTKGWDTEVLAAINNSNGDAIVYCDDNYIAHEKCCVNLFVSRELVERTKKPFMCEFFHADMIDMIWTMVGKITGLLCYLPHVVIQHNHSTRLPEDKWDDTFKRLSPVQKVANGPANQRLAVAYSNVVAKNLIDSGAGKWNVLF